MNRTISDDGLSLLEGYEQFSAEPYDDGYGFMTIGFGHKIRPGEQFDAINEEQGREILQADTAWAEKCVNKFVKYPLSQNEFDALVILTFNIGCQAFSGSTLLKMLNSGQPDEAADEFKKWKFVGKKPSNGLYRRRCSEAEYFRTGHLQSALNIWNDVNGYKLA